MPDGGGWGPLTACPFQGEGRPAGYPAALDDQRALLDDASNNLASNNRSFVLGTRLTDPGETRSYRT